jgi:tape measure domain-containing protein
LADGRDNTRIIIDLDTRIRNLERTLRGLDQVKKKLNAIGGIKSQSQGTDRAVLAAQKLALQQQRLIVQTQELANRQERVRQTSDRLAQSQQRLTTNQQRLDQVQKRVAGSAGQQADAQVKAFRAIQRGLADANTHVRAFRANEAALAKAPQLDAHVRAFRAIQRGAEDANSHVRAFRASQDALRKAPQVDAHVRAFRAIEDSTRRAEAEQRRLHRSTVTLEQSLNRIGGSLRNLGQGLSSLGASLSVALTAPLAALGVLSTRNAVTLDSLQRGLVAITGSAAEAGRQMARLTEIAKLPGIGFQEAIQGSIRLQAVGFSAEVAERSLKQFANAVALTGGGREELSRITVQLGQLSAKGKVLAQDLKPIIEAGPAVGRALLQAFGTVNSEDIQALGLSSEQFIGKLLTALEALPRAGAGAKNTLENFSDAVFRASSAIGNAILPVLTRLIEIAEPIITRLAEGFARLPAPVQTLVVAFGALTAAAGPALFVMGQFASGIGGLLSAFSRLYALGLLPTIEGFKLLTQVMRGSASLAAGQAATTVAAAAGWGALGIAILGVVALAGGIALLLNSQKDAIKISKEQIAATQTEIEVLQDHVKFIDQLGEGVQRITAEQERLAQIYGDLNTQAKVRLTAITDEEKRLAALREELERVIRLRNEERGQQAANLAASLASTTQQIQANLDERDSIAARVQVNAQLAKTIGETGKITVEQSTQLARQGINAATAEDAIGALNAENGNLIESQDTLIKLARELNGTAEEQGAALAQLEKQGAGTARQFLETAQRIGLFKGNIEEALVSMQRFIDGQRAGVPAMDAFTNALRQQNAELLKAGDRADALRKSRRGEIEANVALAREASDSFEGALKFMDAFIRANPTLRASIEKEAQLAGKSFDEFVKDALGGDRASASGTALRNAREQLARALLETAQAQKESELSNEQIKNERLLEANELSYKLQLRSYREYLETRASFTDRNLRLESDAAAKAVETARANEVRLRQAAAKPGLPETERVKRLAQAEQFNEEAIRAETKLAEIESQREQIATELKQALADIAVQQLKDIRQLEVEYGELTGRIEDALNAATDERFHGALSDLGKTQELLNKQLVAATTARQADLVAELTLASQVNQRQIEAIQNIVTQERALNGLAAANQFVRQQKDKQAELERQLTFEVEFRGLSEEKAIARRLEGERRLADSLKVVRDLIQDQVDALNATGIKPPQALIEFIRDINAAIAGLGELSFSEQFRLADKEFNRINDDRISKIQDVERAVRNRTIAEVEGQILIRRINGEYTEDLETQLVLLKQIADASGQESLQRQAESAGETVKDVKDRFADLGKQIESTGKDAARSGFAEFLKDLSDRTTTVQEKLLNLLNNITSAIMDVIAENLSDPLFESLFGGADGAGQGLFDRIGNLFGGGQQGQGGLGAQVGGATATVEAAAAAGALTTGATAAAAALTTGGATAGATLVTSMAASAASFAAAVVAAGAAFAATVAASGASQALGGLGSLAGTAATGGLFSAVPGGAVHILEGGYPEAVLTTDPKYAARQVSILRELIQRTRGFYGRIEMPELAVGGIVSRETVELNLLNSINRAPGFSPHISDDSLQAAAAQSSMNVRIINQVQSRALTRPYITSQEGVRDILNIISENSNTIRRRVG